MSLLLVAWSAASIACGPISQKLGRRKAPYLAGVAATLALWALLIWVPGWSRPVLTALIVAVGVTSSVFVLGFAYAKESVPPRYAGTVSGIVNMGVMAGGMVMQPLVGWVLDRNWSGALTAGGARFYDLAAFQQAFSLVFLWGAVSIVLLAFARETHCRQRLR
jgi:MFS family permease